MNPRYRKAEHVSSRRVQDELVLLDREQGQYLVAREVGPVDSAVIRHDVEGFISGNEAAVEQDRDLVHHYPPWE